MWSEHKYAWPASAITESDMAMLHRVRETLPERVPITQLLATAVRQTYGNQVFSIAEMQQPKIERKAA